MVKKIQLSNITILGLTFLLCGTFAIGITISPLASIFIALIICFLIVALIDFVKVVILTIAVTPILRNIFIFHFYIIDIRITTILWFLIFIIYAFKKVIYDESFFQNSTLMKFILLLILAYILSTLPSGHLLITIRELVQLLYLVIIFLIIIDVLNNVELLKTTVFGLIFCSIIFIGFGIFKVFIGQDPFPSIEIYPDIIYFQQSGLQEQFTLIGKHLIKRADAFFLGPVGTAAYLVPILSIMSGILLTKNIRDEIKLALYFILILGIFLVIMTFSRAGFVALFLLFAILGILKKRYFLSFLILIALFLAIYFYPASHSRVLEIILLKEGSTKIHLTLWLQAIKMFLQKPFFGYGAGTFPIEANNVILKHPFYIPGLNTDSHNMFLQTASETGIMGLIAIIGILSTVLKSIWISLKKRMENSHIDILIGLFIAININIFMNLTMNAFLIESFWVILGVGHAAARIILKEK